MIYNRHAETMPRRQLEALQLERLKHVVRYCYDNVRLYHDRFDAAGIDPDKFKTICAITIRLDCLRCRASRLYASMHRRAQRASRRSWDTRKMISICGLK